MNKRAIEIMIELMITLSEIEEELEEFEGEVNCKINETKSHCISD